MVVILKQNHTDAEKQAVIHAMEKSGVKVMESRGYETTILGAEGDASKVDEKLILQMPGVENVKRISEPYKKANRKYHPSDSVFEVSGCTIGGEKLCVMAGPCSVENAEQMAIISEAVAKSGANALRGGIFKPRTSPYAFQGLGEEGLRLMLEEKKKTGLPIVSELMSADHIALFEEHVDIIQIGARNMQNYDLLKKLGKMTKPILLKRGLNATIEEWILSAEYIMANGNEQVILCERGIRTFETYTRNTLDLSAVQAVKRLSHLPIIVDPSHATGKAWMIEKMSLAAIAAGADGLIIEVHHDPAHALSDGAQSITPDVFDALMQKLAALAPICGRTL